MNVSEASETRDEPRMTVFILDPDGHDTIPSRGWRGRIVSVRACADFEAVGLSTICEEFGPQLELHGVILAPEGRWIVLRGNTRYRERNSGNDG